MGDHWDWDKHWGAGFVALAAGIVGIAALIALLIRHLMQ